MGDTSLLEPGRAAHFILKPQVNVREAAKILGKSVRIVQMYCNKGLFRTAHRSGHGPTSPYLISREELRANCPHLKEYSTET